MKILYSHRTRSADGQYVHIRALTDALLARNHGLRIVGPEGVMMRATRALDVGTGSRRGQTGLKLPEIKLPKPLYELAEMGYSLPAALRLRGVVKDFAPDIIYERYNLFYHAGLWLKKTAQLPLVLEVNAPLREERARHGGLALKGLAQRSEAALWRGADVILPVTGVLAQKIIDSGVAPEKIHIIHNGVDSAFYEHPVAQDYSASELRQRYNLGAKTVLGFTGFVRDWHGVERVLNFMANHHRHDLHLLLVGDGPARAALEHQAQALNLRDRFTVTGIVQRNEVPGLVALFDVALQPAVVDYASPLKLFEYMAMGKAILAPAAKNIEEVLTSGEDALLFDRNDAASFDKNLAALVENETLRQRLGQAARATLEREDYTWAGNARRVEMIAEKLLRR